MAFARHNIEKHRLIEMVRMNPILWDCRLPHYKRSDKKKDGKWCELGRAFNVSGERVQRTFTSLREIFRRELNHEKLLGDRFKSKWEYYDAMGFLKDVIRERKTKDRFKQHLNTMSKEMMDEYAFYAPHQSRNCINLQPDVIINDSPTRLENFSSRSTTPSVSIKEELTDHDGDDEANGSYPRTHSTRRKNSQHQSNQSQAIESPGPTASTSSIHQRQSAKNEMKNITKYSKEEEEEPATMIRQTPREILYTKFGEFLSARLNTLNETVANDLMNRILLLIAEN